MVPLHASQRESSRTGAVGMGLQFRGFPPEPGGAAAVAAPPFPVASGRAESRPRMFTKLAFEGTMYLVFCSSVWFSTSSIQHPYRSSSLLGSGWVQSFGSHTLHRWRAGTKTLVHNLLLALGRRNCHSARSPVVETVKKRRRTKLGKDKRRKHRHWQVPVYYHDGELFARLYTHRAKAAKFAERQKKSPIVKGTRVMQVD